MPQGDRTGPVGMGSMTGRAAGYCGGFSVPGFANPVPGRGFGRGSGRGRAMGRGGGWGRRNRVNAWGWADRYYGPPGSSSYRGAETFAMPYSAPYYSPNDPGPSREEELHDLKNQAKYLEDALEGIKRSIEALKHHNDVQ